MEYNEIIKKLEERLKDMGLLTASRIEYKIDKVDGECDLFGLDEKRKIIYLFEVKQTMNSKKRRYAIKQLEKDINYFKTLHNDYNVHKFIAYSEKNKRGYNVEERE